MKNLYSLIFLLLAFTTSLKAQVSEQEFQALKALYNATSGDNWTNRTGWENINTTATKDDVTIAWFGIPWMSEGHILGIDFTNNNLTGSIPSEFGNLIWLKQLRLYTNNLSGPLPSVFGNYIDLTQLALDGNKFTGPFPASWANLVKLTELSIPNNPFNMPFPSALLTYFPKLKNMYIYGCGFSGELPDLFENTPDLMEINASTNFFNGAIPASLSTLTKLRNLYLDNNAFTGNLPSLESCINIEQIYLNKNSFTGSIPESYNQLNSLLTLNLKNNILSGLIPNDIYSVLHSINLDNNFFSFEGLEPVITKILKVNSKVYSTNMLFPLISNSLSVEAGDPISLNATTLSVYNLGGNNNRYKWFRNDIEVYSGNSPIFTVPSASAVYAGIYRFEVTNTVAINITLRSDNLILSIAGSNHVPTGITLEPAVVIEGAGGPVGTLTATDQDAGDSHTFTLTVGNGTNDLNNGDFYISGNQLIVGNDVDYETYPVLKILITVNDGNGGIFVKAFEINVTDVDEEPVFNGQITICSIDETTPNGSKVVDLTASDPEGSLVTYTIVGGNGAGAFGISGDQLIVSDNTKFSYDAVNSYSLTVRASDGNLTKDIVLTVLLNRINALPVVNAATFTLDENSAVGTIVGTITASDPEGEALTYSIIAGNGLSAFILSGNTLTVANSEPLNYETNPVFDIVINVTDGSSNVQAHVIINLNNIPESTDNDILTFSVPGIVGEEEINAQAHTVRVYVSNVDLRSLATTFTFSPEATSNPASGTTLDFSAPQTITVTSQSGTLQEWVVTLTYRTDKDKFNNQNIKFYPNPASNYLTISGVEEGSKAKIVSIHGQVMYTKILTGNLAQIPVAKFPKGTYLMLIESNNGTNIQKFIKE